MNSRYCFSETKNSFTKSESQPKCNPQRSNTGLGLGMCERHLQMTGNCSPSICEGHSDFSPSLTLFNWPGLPGDCGCKHTTTGFFDFLKLACGGCVDNVRLPCCSSHQVATERALGETAWEGGTVSKSRDALGLLCQEVQTSEIGSVQDSKGACLVSHFAAKRSIIAEECDKWLRNRRESDQQYWGWVLKEDEEFVSHTKRLKGREKFDPRLGSHERITSSLFSL